MRIVAFIGSPIETDEKELVRLAKRLKKEKVNVDIVSFGEEVEPKVKQRKKIYNSYLITIVFQVKTQDIQYYSYCRFSTSRFLSFLIH